MIVDGKDDERSSKKSEKAEDTNKDSLFSMYIPDELNEIFIRSLI